MTRTLSSKTHFKSLICASAAVTALATSTTLPAAAQDEDKFDLETILITARNRAESIQDVPLAVTAFTAEQILKRGVQDLNDVARFTAGFAFESRDGGDALPVIRSQPSLRNTAREQTVASFIDGVYLPRGYVVDLGVNDIQRIEIVKGPQSARYGRNAFAGAINYISERPQDELTIDAQVNYGSDDRFDIGGAVSGPIVKDVLSVRGSFLHSQFEGSWTNDHPNALAGISPGTNGNVGGWNNQFFSFGAIFTPTDWLTVDAAYFNQERREEAQAVRWVNSDNTDGTNTNCGTIQGTGTPSLFCGEYPALGNTVTVEPRGFGRQMNAEIFRISLEAEINEAFTAFYQFGFIDADSRAARSAEEDTINCGGILGPVSGFPSLCNFQGAPVGFLNYKQHEARITYDEDGAFAFTLGGFLMNGDDEPFAISINQQPLGTDPLDLQLVTTGGLANFVFRDELNVTKVRSLFLEAIYRLPNEKTRLGFEGRYNTEEITTTNRRTDPFTQVGQETFKFFTPRVTVEHDLTADNMLYATVARGAKAGGFNTAALTPGFDTFEPEFNWTYEIGAKNQFLDRALTINVAAFYTDWSNLQINQVDPNAVAFTTTLTTNLGDARVFGLELEGQWLATENLSFDFAASWADAKYKDGVTDARFTGAFIPDGLMPGDAGYPLRPNPCDDVACTPVFRDINTGEIFTGNNSIAGLDTADLVAIGADIGGNNLEQAPSTQLSIGAQWEKEISDDLTYLFRMDAAYQSSFFASSINQAEIQDRIVVNSRLSFNLKEQFQLSLWARNLFDKRYVSNSLQIVQSRGVNILSAYLGERRTFGVQLNFNY